MSITSFARSFGPASHSAATTLKRGLLALKADPAIIFYPLPIFIIAISALTTVSSIIYHTANVVAHQSVFSGQSDMASLTFSFTAIVLSAIYGYMMVSFFTCVIAASVIGQLEGESAPLLYGLKAVSTHFRRIAKFASIAIILIPLGIISQRHKVHRPRGALETLGSSLSLNVAQLAPAILVEKTGIEDTILTSLNTIGKAWRENLIIKAGIYTLIILIGIITAKTASDSLAQLLLFLMLIIIAKVLTAVFTATLYWEQSKKHIVSKGLKPHYGTAR